MIVAQLVDDNSIKRFERSLGELKVKKALEFYNKNMVKIIEIDVNADGYYTYLKVIAEVKDKYNEIHRVYIRFINDELEYKKYEFKDLSFYITMYGCDCKPYSYNVCEHILACVYELKNNYKYLNKINTELEMEEKRIEKQMFKTVIDLFSYDNKKEKSETDLIYQNGNKKQLNSIRLNKDLVILPVIKKDHSDRYVLSFKIGEERFYKVKSLEDFYKTYSSGEICSYGAKLVFKNEEASFEKSSIDFLKLMLKYGQSIVFGNIALCNRTRYDSNIKIPSSSIVMNGSIVDELFEIFKKNFGILEFEGKNIKLEFNKNNNIIKFELEDLENNEYKLFTNFKANIIFEGEKNIYVTDLKNVNIYNKLKNRDVFKLLELFRARERDEFIFGEDELINFINKVYPRIKENISLDKFSNDLREKYIPHELGVKVYLDLTEKGDILATVKFCYRNNKEFDPYLNENNDDFPRDYNAENNVKQIFINDGFIYDRNYESFIMKNEDDIYNFITNSVNYYMEKFEVLISEEFKKQEIKKTHIISFGVKVQNNLLNVDFSGFNYDYKELQDLMKNYKLKKKYYRLKSGEFISLENSKELDLLEDLTDRMDVNYKELSKGKLRLPINRSIYLNKLLEKFDNSNVEIDSEFKNIIHNTEKNNNIDMEIDIPQSLKNVLRIYQKIGYKWLKVLDYYKFGGILADDMGLGKTLQVITLFLAEKDNLENKKNNFTSIVVSPSSLTLNWENEINKFAPSLKTLVIRGNLAERKALMKSINKVDIVIISYDLLKRDIDMYKEQDISFRYIIADEAQYIKNSNTQNAKALKTLNGETRFALTGTPIENSLAELWSIFDYIMPGYLYSYAKFKRDFETKIVKEDDNNVMNRLKTMIEPFILRRTKKQVLTELPDKTISVLKNEMEEEQEKIYFSYLAQIKRKITNEVNFQDFEKSQIKILALLTRLRQICCHPSLFIENYKGESSKLSQALELIQEAVDGGHKVLLFSTYTLIFDIIEKKLENMGIKYYKLTGATAVDKRIKMVDDFNKNEEIKVFLISLKAGGTGLNLTGADVVIHYDPWWNLSAENQATDRAYRIGQRNNVQVYKLITKNSIEEKINELQERKALLIENVLDTKEAFINKLSKEEILSLLE